MIWIVYHGSYPQISLVVVCKVLNPQYCHFYHTFCPGTEFYQSDKWLLSSEETAFVGRLYKYVLLFFLYFIYFFVLHLCACLFMCFQINRNFSELCQSGKKNPTPGSCLGVVTVFEATICWEFVCFTSDDGAPWWSRTPPQLIFKLHQRDFSAVSLFSCSWTCSGTSLLIWDLDVCQITGKKRPPWQTRPGEKEQKRTWTQLNTVVQ